MQSQRGGGRSLSRKLIEVRKKKRKRKSIFASVSLHVSFLFFSAAFLRGKSATLTPLGKREEKRIFTPLLIPAVREKEGGGRIISGSSSLLGKQVVFMAHFLAKIVTLLH